MNFILRSILIVLLLTAVSPAAHAYAFIVSGQVTSSETGAPVDSAAVTFVALDTEEIYTTATDATGHYSIELPGTTDVADAQPSAFRLGQNYPNPFNPATTIEYELDTPSRVRLDIFSITGQRVRTLIDESQSNGAHRAVWYGRDDNGAGVGAGVYLYRLTAGKKVATRKMLLMDGGGRAVPVQTILPSFGKAAETEITYGMTVSADGFEIFSEVQTVSPNNVNYFDVLLDILALPGGSYEEARACEAAFKEDHPNAVINWSEDRSYPQFIISPDFYLPDVTAITEENVYTAALALLDMYPELFRTEGLEFEPRISYGYGDGIITDLDLFQYHNGVRVDPGVIHFEFFHETGKQRIKGIKISIYNRDVRVDTTPFISEEKAWDVIASYFNKQVKSLSPELTPLFKIVKDPNTSQWRLSWILLVDVTPDYYPLVYVDAHSGEVYRCSFKTVNLTVDGDISIPAWGGKPNVSPDSTAACAYQYIRVQKTDSTYVDIADTTDCDGEYSFEESNYAYRVYKLKGPHADVYPYNNMGGRILEITDTQ